MDTMNTTGVYRGAYDADTVFYQADTTSYNDVIYRWIGENEGSGITPGEDATVWEAAKFSDGDGVMHEGYFYRWIGGGDQAGVAPGSDDTKWQKIGIPEVLDIQPMTEIAIAEFPGSLYGPALVIKRRHDALVIRSKDAMIKHPMIKR